MSIHEQREAEDVAKLQRLHNKVNKATGSMAKGQNASVESSATLREHICKIGEQDSAKPKTLELVADSKKKYRLGMAATAGEEPRDDIRAPK